ncbi:MAG: YncE family protein [Proteobacteria bacterium]|nr:YncE family protein [Pseudomonadota bacterium]
MIRVRLVPALAALAGVAVSGAVVAQTASPAPAEIVTVPGMPPVIDPTNLYSEIGPDRLSPAVRNDLARVYVPNRRSNTVTVIDQNTLAVVDTIKVGRNPQHVVPSWDLRTLWVANNAEGRTDGSLTPIDPATGKAGAAIPVDDPYNVYFTPSGRRAIIVAEELRRLDFRNPQTMKLDFSIAVPKCGGVNHADFSIDGSFALFTCEFDGAVTKIDLVNRAVVGTLMLTPFYDRPSVVAQLTTFEKKPALVFNRPELGRPVFTSRGMPQDIRISPDGKLFFVADMLADGVHVVDGASFRQIGFIPTGLGAHGLYPSRNGKQLYVANRGSNKMIGRPGGAGSVSVIDFATRKVVQTWPIPEGGSPDMGNVSADGKYLWLSGRFDDVVYRIDTMSGAVDKIKVGREPHGLTVWPQPGRYSLGHTGNLR